jgi:hypothetical protein
MNLNNFLQDFHSAFSYKEINDFYKECRSNQVLHSCDYKLKYQPTYWMYFDCYNYGYNEYGCKAMRFKGDKPKKYDIWMNIKEDYTGSYYRAFYPKKTKEGSNIDVIYKGVIFDGIAEWEHSERGLWDVIIYKIIILEAYYLSKKHSIVNWINSKLKEQIAIPCKSP